MVQVHEVVRPRGRFLVPVVDLWVARSSARRGGRDAGSTRHASSGERAAPIRTAFLWRLGQRVLAQTLLARARATRPRTAIIGIDTAQWRNR